MYLIYDIGKFCCDKINVAHNFICKFMTHIIEDEKVVFNFFYLIA
jgi:hypothetical protein